MAGGFLPLAEKDQLFEADCATVQCTNVLFNHNAMINGGRFIRLDTRAVASQSSQVLHGSLHRNPCTSRDGLAMAHMGVSLIRHSPAPPTGCMSSNKCLRKCHSHNGFMSTHCLKRGCVPFILRSLALQIRTTFIKQAVAFAHQDQPELPEIRESACSSFRGCGPRNQSPWHVCFFAPSSPSCQKEPH